jgi:hypothetical protein
MNTHTQRQTLLLRLPLVGLVAFAVLMGLWGALQRVGWGLPNVSMTLVGVHGPLMIGGVLGTLISLERAVALSAFTNSKRPWSYLVPAVCGAGGVLLVVSGASLPARLLLTVGSAGLVLVLAVMLRRQIALYTLLMTLGAVLWLIGNGLWLSGQPVYQVVHVWIGFLVLTIVSERLELSRVTRLPARSYQLFTLAVGIYIVGVILTVFDLNSGVRVAGLGEIALAAWLLGYDIARHTVRREGLTRFIAVCLLVGYVWLGVGGIMGIAFGAVYAGFPYDALLHSILLGFVVSMIFGHAPIIFPALTGRAVHFSRFSYVYLFILHTSLILRLISDLNNWTTGRMWSGLINVLAILIFLATTVYSNFLRASSRTK